MDEEKILRKVIITAAVTGAGPTPTMSPYLPITPEQITDDAVGAFEAGAKPSELQKELYMTVVEMQQKFASLLKPGVITHELARWRPKPGENFKTAEQMRKWRAKWSNHFGGMGIAWGSGPSWHSDKDAEIALERNMTVTYHAILYAEGEAGGARLRIPIGLPKRVAKH